MINQFIQQVTGECLAAGSHVEFKRNATISDERVFRPVFDIFKDGEEIEQKFDTAPFIGRVIPQLEDAVAQSLTAAILTS